MKLSRAERLPALAPFLLLVVAVGCSCRSAPAGARPNILLITIEATSAKNVHAYGYPRETTPTLDRLAGEGWLWENAFAGGDCTPISLATIMTGVSAPIPCVRSFADRIPNGMPTLAETLRRAGYATFTAGWAAELIRHEGLDRGFQRLDVEDRWARYGVAGENRWYRFHVPADKLVRAAARFARENHDRPWFIHLHFNESHCPYTAPVYYREPFHNDAMYKNDRRAVTQEDLKHYCVDELLPEIGKQSSQARDYVAAHDAAIFNVDSKINNLLEDLDTIGLYDPTVIAVTSDHGELTGEHGIYFAHGVGLYDELLHVPLIIKPAAVIKKGTRSAATAGHVDIAPTLLALAGIPAPEGMTGRSLLSPDAERADDPPRALLALSCSGTLGVRRGRFALVQRLEPTDPDDPRPTVFLDNGEERPVPPTAEARELARALDEANGILARCETSAHESLSASIIRRLKALGYLP